MKRAATASECSDNDVFFDDGDMLKDGSVICIAIYHCAVAARSQQEEIR